MKRYFYTLTFPLLVVVLSAQAYATPWDESYFPNVTLTSHEGEDVRFFDDLIKDKVVVINFIFTRCTESCPLETARLKNVADILGDRVGKDIFFYSISIEPDYDTPEVLKAYTERFNIGPGWLFLTGDEDDIILLRKKLGLYLDYITQEDEDSTDHNLSLIIGNQATGRWMKRSPFENAQTLSAQIGGWLHNWKATGKTPGLSGKDYAQAPKMRSEVSEGETLFRVRCIACHSIGRGSESNPTDGKLGPDLLDVSKKREPLWLRRWLAEPDKMIEEGDTIAVALYQQYNQVSMPNLRLSETHIDQLIEYMDKESKRRVKAKTKQARHH